MPRPLKIVTTILVLTSCCLFFIFNWPAAAPAPKTKVVAAPLKVINPSKSAAWQELTLLGRVESSEITPIRASQDTYVKRLFVQPGQRIAQGEPLLVLDAKEAELDLSTRAAGVARSSNALATLVNTHKKNQQVLVAEQEVLRLLKSEFARLQQLRAENYASQSALEAQEQLVKNKEVTIKNIQVAIDNFDFEFKQLQSEQQQAQDALALAELEAGRLDMRAPFEAVVAQINVAPGSRVRANEALLTLHNYQARNMVVNIPQQFIARLQQSPKAYALFNNERLDFSHLGALVTANSFGQQAYFTVPETSSLPLLAQQLVSVLLPVSGAYALPASSVYDNNKVFIVDTDNILQEIDVSVVGKAKGESLVLVKSTSLQPDNKVVVTRRSGLRAGQVVTQLMLESIDD